MIAICFGFFLYKRDQHFVSFLSSSPPRIPVRKRLIVFPPSFVNLLAVRWRTWKMCFPVYCLRLWRQSVNSIPTNLCSCVCMHIVHVCVLLLTTPVTIQVCEATRGGLHLFSQLCGFLSLRGHFSRCNIRRVPLIRITTRGYSYY